MASTTVDDRAASDPNRPPLTAIESPARLHAARARARATPECLREVITEIDGLAQEGFSEIAAIAKLAMGHLKTPKGQHDTDTIFNALHAILGKALDTENSVSSAAEEVGCRHLDRSAEEAIDV